MGLLIRICHSVRKRINKIYSYSLFHGKQKVYLDCSAHVIGAQYMTFGKSFYAGKHFRIEAIDRYGKQRFNPQIIIGDHVSVGDFNHIGAVNLVKIGSNVLFGSKCYITDHNHGIYSGGVEESDPAIPPEDRTLTVGQSVIIEDKVWIGDNVVILPGVTIGAGSVIGANAVVIQSIPSGSIAVGIPAKVIKRWDKTTNSWTKEIHIEDDKECHYG